MDEIIRQLKTPEECMYFIEKHTDLINQARQRTIELRALTHKNENIVENELLKALYAYEEILSKKNNRRTRASRTWQMVNRYGIVGAAERAVNRNIEPMGYKMLVEMGLKNITFEAVIANHPEEFSIEAVKKANERLEELKLIKF